METIVALNGLAISRAADVLGENAARHWRRYECRTKRRGDWESRSLDWDIAMDLDIASKNLRTLARFEAAVISLQHPAKEQAAIGVRAVAAKLRDESAHAGSQAEEAADGLEMLGTLLHAQRDEEKLTVTAL